MAFSRQQVNRRQFCWRATKATAAVVAATPVYAWRLEPHWVDYQHQTMTLPKLPKHWHGKRLVQISDLHVGPIVDEVYLRSVLREVAAIEPDLLLITGDFMTCKYGERVYDTTEVMREVAGIAPSFSVLGNHDYGRGFRQTKTAAELTDSLQSIGIRVLRNEVEELAGLQIGGMDDLWSRRCKIQQTVEKFDRTRPAIVMCHNPDCVDRTGWLDYRGWILSGHTHGGQCRLPGHGAIYAPIRNYDYIAGRVDLEEGRVLYVNRGIGYKKRVRFLSRPEVTVFTLEDEPLTEPPTPLP